MDLIKKLIMLKLEKVEVKFFWGARLMFLMIFPNHSTNCGEHSRLLLIVSSLGSAVFNLCLNLPAQKVTKL